MRLAGCSDEEAIRHTEKAFAERFISFVRDSKDGESRVTSLCKTILNNLELCTVEGGHAFQPLYNDLQLVSHALLAIVGGEPGCHPSDAVKDLQKASCANPKQQSLATIINAALTTSAYWQDCVPNKLSSDLVT